MVTYSTILFSLLRPLGFLYAMLMRLRAFLFKRNICKSYSIAIPVISVGNLRMGGSGKTPFVIFLAEFFLEKGFKPAVISRGYGGSAAQRVNIVSDGKTIYLDSKAAGDEPRLIAESLPGVVVLTGKKRIHPCRYASTMLHCDLIILDDGFQHLHVQRDFDFLLFNCANLFRNMNVFPGGMLREPLSAMQRADCVVLSGYNEENSEQAKRFSRYLTSRRQDTPLYLSSYHPRWYVDRSGQKYPLHHLSEKVMAFCGIASPERFFNTLQGLGLNLVCQKSYRDHAHYTDESIQQLEEIAKLNGAKILVTTEKDLVKLSHFSTTLPLFGLAMQVEVDSKLTSHLLSALNLADKKDQESFPK